MHQTGRFEHLKRAESILRDQNGRTRMPGPEWPNHESRTRKAMTPAKTNMTRQRLRGSILLALATIVALAIPALQAQSEGSQTQSQPPASSQPAQDVPDAPSTVQPPAPKPALPPAPPPGAGT